MAMVRITNGDVTSRVPYSAYISMYKRLGFTIEGEEPVKPQKKVETPNKEQPKEETEGVTEDESEVADETDVTEEEEDEEDEEAADDEAFVEDILEKPLSQWTPDELRKFAEIKNIDTSKAKKVSEARSIIKKYLEEQEKAQTN